MHSDYLNHDVSSHGIDMLTGVNTNATFFINETAFNPSIKGSYYNGIYFKSNELKGLKYFEDKYVSKTEELKRKIDKYAKENLNFKSNFSNIKNNPTLLSNIKEFLHNNGYISDAIYGNDLAFAAYLGVAAEQVSKAESIFAIKT